MKQSKSCAKGLVLIFVVFSTFSLFSEAAAGGENSRRSFVLSRSLCFPTLSGDSLQKEQTYHTCEPEEDRLPGSKGLRVAYSEVIEEKRKPLHYSTTRSFVSPDNHVRAFEERLVLDFSSTGARTLEVDVEPPVTQKGGDLFSAASVVYAFGAVAPLQLHGREGASVSWTLTSVDRKEKASLVDAGVFIVANEKGKGVTIVDGKNRVDGVVTDFSEGSRLVLSITVSELDNEERRSAKKRVGANIAEKGSSQSGTLSISDNIFYLFTNKDTGVASHLRALQPLQECPTCSKPQLPSEVVVEAAKIVAVKKEAGADAGAITSAIASQKNMVPDTPFQKPNPKGVDSSSCIVFASVMRVSDLSTIPHILSRWTGPVAVLVYAEDIVKAFAAVSDLSHTDEEVAKRVTFRFVRAARGPPPVSMLRNMALDIEAGTCLSSLVVDGGAVPSEEMETLLLKSITKTKVEVSSRTVFVIPSFDVWGISGADDLPTTMEKLLALQKEGMISPSGSWPQRSADSKTPSSSVQLYERWQRASQPFSIANPAADAEGADVHYVLPASASAFPQDSLSLNGYPVECSRQSHLLELTYGGFDFVVVTNAFLARLSPHDTGYFLSIYRSAPRGADQSPSWPWELPSRACTIALQLRRVQLEHLSSSRFWSSSGAVHLVRFLFVLIGLFLALILWSAAAPMKLKRKVARRLRRVCSSSFWKARLRLLLLRAGLKRRKAKDEGDNFARPPMVEV